MSRSVKGGPLHPTIIYGESGNRLVVQDDGSILSEIKNFSPAAALQEYRLAVQRGLVSGVSILSGFGERQSMGTTATGEDIWRGAATTIPTPPAAGEQMTITSSSPNDTAGGTGVQEVEVHYLNAAGVEMTETKEMDGTGDVDTTATDMRFIQGIHATSVGSNGVAVGNIIIHKKGAAATIYNTIVAGGNESLVIHRMVPAGKTFYLMNWHCTEGNDKRIAVRIRSTDRDGALVPGVFLFKGVAFINGASSGSLIVNAIIPALSIVKVSGWAVQTGGDVSAQFWGYLVDD